MKPIVSATLFAPLLLVISCTSSNDENSQKTIPRNIEFYSDSSWEVFDSTNVSVGNAQAVCLNSTSPANCPNNATLFASPYVGWGADLSSIQNAVWIWAPNINGDTSMASLAQFSFEKTVFLAGEPESAIFYMAADDSAELYVNDSLVGAIGSITNNSEAGIAQSTLQSFDILSFLHNGDNLIQVKSVNGPDSFASVTNATYSQNPAGVVFGGIITQK